MPATARRGGGSRLRIGTEETAAGTRCRFLPPALAVVVVCLTSCGVHADFRFTVTADMRGHHEPFRDVCEAINDIGGPGAFHVSVGDVDGRVWENRQVIDSEFGPTTAWYPLVGNHEAEDGVEMEWLRDEYDNGNGARTPLSDPARTNADGPEGTRRLAYTWDSGNAHFVALNPYWDGGTNEGTGTSTSGDDTATDGDVVSAQRAWLAADLAANGRPFVFVFGHEPAFPEHRHVGDSLDQYGANRDAFWQLLQDEGVQAFFCGHTHVYSRRQGDKNGLGETWQIDVGNAGNESGSSPDGYTFLDVAVGSAEVTFRAWRDPTKDGTFALADTWSAPVPEPATVGLLAAGLALWAARRRPG